MIMRYLRPGISLMAVMTIVLGILYPLAVTGIGGMMFPARSAGSLVRKDGALVGSSLIGQNFSDPKYFWGRPSATAPQPYNGLASGGSNLGPLNPALFDKVAANVKLLQDADPDNHAPIPVELVTASASGLDPHISPAAADYQAARVARARRVPLAVITSLISAHRSEPLLGLFGEPTVNVLELNLALDLRK